MNDSEKLKLLAGLSFFIGQTEIKPLTLEQIASVGYEQYNLYLSNIVAEPSEFSLNKDVNISDITTYDIILGNMYYGTDEYREFILNAFKLFFQHRVRFAYCKGFFYIDNSRDNKIICKDNYEEIKRILKINNCINKEKKEEFNPANSKAEEIKMKILKARQKSQSKTQVTFYDLVSVLAAKGNGLNILNIWNLTFFQFSDQFARMQMIEDYDINIRSLLAGAKKEEVKLKHYIRPIENEE